MISYVKKKDTIEKENVNTFYFEEKFFLSVKITVLFSQNLLFTTTKVISNLNGQEKFPEMIKKKFVCVFMLTLCLMKSFKTCVHSTPTI